MTATAILAICAIAALPAMTDDAQLWTVAGAALALFLAALAR